MYSDDIMIDRADERLVHYEKTVNAYDKEGLCIQIKRERGLLLVEGNMKKKLDFVGGNDA